jgi:transcriptional regulator with GAF, ATPase, and Fis domain
MSDDGYPCRNSYKTDIVGHSEAIKKVLRLAEHVAGTDSTVLVMGETGTGKELLARAIHCMSERRNRPMVTVNCSALPSSLIEGELFGHERGAFTGACCKGIGRFEMANGSTLFLDEIGDLAPESQPRLLRVLQDGTFERLGSSRSIKVDVRIIAATNKDLAEQAKAGTFRKDLYYRLNVFPITLPPLRNRCEDIPGLVWAFVHEFGERLGKIVDHIPDNTLKTLQNYPWPGNVRELKNVIEQAMITSTEPTLNVAFPDDFTSQECEGVTLEEIEKNHILKVLESTGGRVKGSGGAARILGMNPSTLFSRMRKLGVKPLQ